MHGESKDEFLADLNRLHQEAGRPSFRYIASKTRGKAYACPKSSAADLLAGKRRVHSRTLIGFLHACQKHAKDLEIPLADTRVDAMTWQVRYQQLARFYDTADEPVPEANTPGGLTAATSAAGELPEDADERPPPRRPVVLPARDSRYMVFANGQFDHLPDLPAAREQATGLADALKSTAPWLAAELHLDRISADVEESVRRASNDVRGLLVLHFTTHGVLSDDGAPLLTFRDSGDGVPGVPIDRILEATMGRHQPTAVVIDRCFPERERAYVPRFDRWPGPFALWTVSEMDAFQRANLTVALTQTLLEGSAADHELLTLGAVNRLIALRLRQEWGFHTCVPELVTMHGIGDVVLAANPAHVRPFAQE